MLYGLTFIAGVKFVAGFSAKVTPDEVGAEGYHRLISIFTKNQYGYHTRFMSDFDLFLEALFNEKFINDSTLYLDDPGTSKEIEDMEAGLNSDFAHSDVRHLVHDKEEGHHESFKSLRYPDRIGTNYERSDNLSCYKILPKGVKPLV